MDPTQRAISAAGGPTAVARAIGITPQAVGQWKVVPVERVRQLESMSGVSRRELRPDIYGDELDGPKEAAE